MAESDWDLLDGSAASDWEVLSHTRFADDDARSVATDTTDVTDVSEISNATLCTLRGWPALARAAHAAHAARAANLGDEADEADEAQSYKDALLQGGGGLEGDKASKMAKGPSRLPGVFVNGYRKKTRLPAIEEEMDADEEWWLRKGQGSLLAKRRWKFDRRPQFCNEERRQGFGRQQPTWEYEFGQSAEGYCAPETEDDDDL